MHTTQGPSGQYYAHNGDFSGSVKAAIPVREQASYPHDDHACASQPHHLMGEEGLFVEVEIPFEDIRALYLRHVRSQMISRLENASDEELEASLTASQPPAVTPARPARDTRPEPYSRTWWAARQANGRMLVARAPQDLRTGDLKVGGIHVHLEDVGVLARIDDLPASGAVLFSVWAADYPDEWQEGAGLASHAEFRQLYPTVYSGVDPVTGELER